MIKKMTLFLMIFCILSASYLPAVYAESAVHVVGGCCGEESQDVTDENAQSKDTNQPKEPDRNTDKDNDEYNKPTLIAKEGCYFSTISFASDHYMAGLFPEVKEGFNIGDWDLLDAQLTLSLSTTQLVQECVSDITIAINGVRFYSERIPITDGTHREIIVKIPVEHINEGYNTLSVEGYLRTNNGYPCVDDVTVASWMNIFKESFIEISYFPLQECNSIADFYTGFSSIEALENNESAVVLPTNYDNDEIDAALTIMAGISRKAIKDYQNIKLIACDTCAGAQGMKYVIYVAKTEHLPEILSEALLNNKSIQEYSPGMFLIQGMGEINVLVVTGKDKALFDKAAAILSDSITMNQLKGKTKIIENDEDVFVRKEGAKQYTKLTEEGTYFDGPFRQKHNYYINFESNRKLTYGSELALYFRYSKNLDFDHSLVSVYVNDIPIGSLKLSEARAEGDNIVLPIPTDINVVGSFTLTVAFDLETGDWCSLRESETPWAYVTNESILKLNSVEVPYYLFENYPYPFISGGELNDVVFVLPDNNEDIDLNMMGRFMLTLGQYMKYNTGNLSVARATNAGDLDGKNVITVGTYKNNPFIAGLNEELFFRFYQGGVGLMSNEKLVLEATYSGTLGTAQIIESPYSKTKNAILVMASSNKADLKNAMTYFGDTKELWKLYGDGLVADKEDIFLYRFKQENDKEDISEDFFERADVVNLIYVAGAILAILIVAVIFITIKYRRIRDNEEIK